VIRGQLRRDSRPLPRVSSRSILHRGDGIVVRRAGAHRDCAARDRARANSPSHYFLLNALLDADCPPNGRGAQFTQEAFKAARVQAAKSLAPS